MEPDQVVNLQASANIAEDARPVSTLAHLGQEWWFARANALLWRRINPWWNAAARYMCRSERKARASESGLRR